MVEPLNLRNLAWVLTTMLEIILLFYLLWRRFYRTHPAFFIYVSAAIVQSVTLACAYRYWGAQSMQAWNIGWGGQAAIICARWCAVAEIARKILGNYGGIRRMSSLILFVLGICVLVYSIASSENGWTLIVLHADRAVELCIGVFIVFLFVFAGYYRLPIMSQEKLLGVGFCLYSCFSVINDSIYENSLSTLGGLWNYLDILIFLATLLLWFGAARMPAEPQKVAAEIPLTPEVYGELSQKLDSRLHLLNHRLNHLLRSEGSKP